VLTIELAGQSAEWEGVRARLGEPEFEPIRFRVARELWVCAITGEATPSVEVLAGRCHGDAEEVGRQLKALQKAKFEGFRSMWTRGRRS
jgi:hypothetical protein